MKNKSVIFITGLGGTGKSTIWHHFLENPIPGFSFYDFDKGKYKAPPYDKHKTEHHPWRIKQTNWWLKVAHKEYDVRHNILVIMGLSLYPNGLLELPNAKYFKSENIHFGLLTCEPEERKKRLHKRGDSHHWKGHQPWYDEFFEEMKKEGAIEINTTCESIQKTAESIKKWLVGITK